MSDNKTITVTGCVQNISSASSSGSMGRGFLLANAMMGDARGGSTAAGTSTTTSPAPTGTSGTAAAGSPTSGTYPAAGSTATAHPSAAHANGSYVLEGSDAELKNHVGHKVEVTGTVDSHADMTKGSTSTSSTTSTSATTADNSPKLHVSSVRMIASDCSSK